MTWLQGDPKKVAYYILGQVCPEEEIIINHQNLKAGGKNASNKMFVCLPVMYVLFRV